jgi:hypothetical protein
MYSPADQNAKQNLESAPGFAGRRFGWRTVVAVFLSPVLMLGSFAQGAEKGASTKPLTRASFVKHAEPFLTKYCGKCHGPDKQKGDLNFKKISLDMTHPQTGQTWTDVFAFIQFSEMPPSKSKLQPPAAEKRVFLAWLDGELTRVGRGFGLKEKLKLPEFANYLDHATLFDGSITAKAYTPARLWRQRPAIYDEIWGNNYGRTPGLSVKIGSAFRMNARNLVKRGPHKGKVISLRGFNPTQYANPFYEFVNHASGFTDYAIIKADQASLEALLTNAETMAEILTEGQKISVVTEVKNKDSRAGNNHGGFVGGVETRSIERRGRIPLVFKQIADSDAVDQKAFDPALDIAFALFLHRAPRPAERQHYWQKVFQKNVELGNKMALQAVLVYITLTPEFVYRMELGMSKPGAYGRRMLSPQELVYAIHHAFEDASVYGIDAFDTVNVYTKDSEAIVKEAMNRTTVRYPRDAWLATQWREGKLKTTQDVETAVRHYLNERPRTTHLTHGSRIRTVRNPRILQFFREFFGYHKAPTVFKDVETFKKIDGFKHFHGHTAQRLKYDTDNLILTILREDKNVFYELLTTNRVFVSYWPGTNDAKQVKQKGGPKGYTETHDAQSYNLDPLKVGVKERPKKRTPYLVPKDQRCGVLTQPSWLVAHSGNFDNDPVRRGKWIRDKLLAGYIMDVPINVDAQVPDSEHQTLRERFSVVHEEECWRCHKKMNPLGMVFEAYNHVGRFRTLEKGKPTNTLGAISHTKVMGLDGKVANVRQMMERIAKSDLARQSFMRHVFRYWMGRNELLSDSQTLIAMDKAYTDSGGSFKACLVSLLTSDSFLYRK